MHQALLQAQQTYQITDLIAFTFKESYQLKRYQKLGIKTDNSWQMLYGALDPVLKKLSETSQCKIKATNDLLEDFLIHLALKQALAELKIPAHQTVVVTGI